MDDLLTWLRAQLDEDERLAQEALPEMGDPAVFPDYRTFDVPAAVDDHVARHGPARVLREVAAKRRIVDLLETEERVHAEHDEYRPAVNKLWGGGRRSALRQVARLLALPYADRPGYREEWRP